MKILSLILVLALLTGCSADPVATVSTTESTAVIPEETLSETQYASRFDSVTEITLSDSGLSVNGGGETEAVFTSRDIIYYEEKESYESGNPYGEGAESERHSTEEAAAHTVVNITAPGAYRVSGTLSAGQLRIDLGDDAYEDPEAVVELILSGADITCTVAPAILFLNTYECDGNWSTDTAKPDVDTRAAGANLILEGENTATGSHVAKIFKDKEGEKKLWKQDGAVYSYMSLNVYGPGSLDITADNEGLDTELHLTIHSGDIAIRSGNDGINTNEDGVSVTTINGGSVRILAGLGEEGDGIDSNGYLVINGGTVISSAKPAADAGLDSDLGSYIHGGTVIALGSTMDWAESDSRQVTMNLQYAFNQTGSTIEVQRDGSSIFSYDLAADPLLKDNLREFKGMILSSPAFTQGETYSIFLDGVQLAYSGNDVGMGGFGGGRGMGGGQRGEKDEGGPPALPEGEPPALPEGEPPALPEGQMPQMPKGEFPEMAEGVPPEKPEGEMPTRPEGLERPEGDFRQPGGGGFGGEYSTDFYMADMVNAFSAVKAAEA